MLVVSNVFVCVCPTSPLHPHAGCDKLNAFKCEGHKQVARHGKRVLNHLNHMNTV